MESVKAHSLGNSIYAVGSDKRLKELVNNDVINSITSNITITQLAFSPSTKTLFAGTERGTIRIYKLPLGSEFTELLVRIVFM